MRKRMSEQASEPVSEPSSTLISASQFPDPDAAYAALVEARRGLSETAAAELDARLVLILANHIGNLDVLREAIALATTAIRKD